MNFMTEGNHGKNPNQFGQHQDLNLELSELIGAMLCAFKNFITDHTSQSLGAGIRAFIFNQCNDATVRTQEVPLACDITYMQSLHAINGLPAVGRMGNLLCGRPPY